MYCVVGLICDWVRYAGLTLIIAQVLNYVQTGSTAPLILLCGLGLVGLGLAFLTLTQHAKDQQRTLAADGLQALPTTRHASPLEGAHVQQPHHNISTTGVLSSMGTSSLHDIDLPSAAGNSSSVGTVQNPGVATSDTTGLTTRGAMLVCVVAGIAGAGWSPLSTYARSGGSVAQMDPVHDAAICLVVFQLGQLCALPSITNLGGWLTGTGVIAPICDLNVRSAAFGILCGASVSTGYMAYFTSSVSNSSGLYMRLQYSDTADRLTIRPDQAFISPTVAFGIVACNPVLAMIIDVLRGEFRGTSTSVKVFLLLSICSYGAAIGTLSQIPPQHTGGSSSGAGYQISVSTDLATGRPISSISMPFSNAHNLHAAPVANFHAGCEESPFEFGWVQMNSGKVVWLPANFSLTQLDTDSATVTLTGHHPSLQALDGELLQLTEVRYAWSGQPQCVLYSGQGSYANASALPVSS